MHDLKNIFYEQKLVGHNNFHDDLKFNLHGAVREQYIRKLKIHHPHNVNDIRSQRNGLVRYIKQTVWMAETYSKNCECIGFLLYL